MGSRSENDDDAEDEGDSCVAPLGEKHDWTSNTEAEEQSGRARKEQRADNQEQSLCAVDG